MSRRTTPADALLLATVFVITFAKIRWDLGGGSEIYLYDITALLFLLAFALERFELRDWSVPRTAAVLAAFFGVFVLVYLVGFFNVDTAADRNQFAKGLAKFLIHFAFLIAAVAHVVRRSARFYWLTLASFVAGVTVNAAYGIVQLAVARAGGNLDEIFLGPLGAYQRGGINVFGAVQGEDVYRVNALTLDPNHLGIMLVVPLLILLPIYIRLERGHRLRAPLALVLAFLGLVELATLSRSGLLGIAVGLAVLALPYRHLLVSSRMLVPAAAVAAVVGIVVARRADFFEAVLRARAQLGGGGTRVRLEMYDLLQPVLESHPLFGLGLNTFSTYYEFITGRTNWGPHSYYITLLTETGLVGTAVFLVFLVYFFRRLRALRALGAALARAGDAAAARVRPLAWGCTAALAGTLAANAFYVTMQMYYFFVFILLAVAAPVVFARR